MKIVIKPMGAIILVVTLVLLGFLAFRQRNSQPDSTQAKAVPIASLPPGQDISEVYTDKCENGWEIQGWAKDIVPNEPRFVHNGQSSIRATFQSFEGCKFHHPDFDSSPYDRVAVTVMGADKGGQTLRLSGTAGASNGTSKEMLTDPLPSGRWVTVVAPLSAMGLDKVPNMSSFWVQEGDGKTATIYIDDVRLLKRGDPDPTGPRVNVSPAAK